MKQPHLHAWAEADEVVRLVEQAEAKNDPDPKALACYGLLVSCPAAPDTLTEQVWLRFVESRLVSAVTTQYLAWCCEKLEQVGKTALIMIWDNASWHRSKEVRTWIRAHNRAVRQHGTGVRIVTLFCTSSPAHITVLVCSNSLSCQRPVTRRVERLASQRTSQD